MHGEFLDKDGIYGEAVSCIPIPQLSLVEYCLDLWTSQRHSIVLVIPWNPPFMREEQFKPKLKLGLQSYTFGNASIAARLPAAQHAASSNRK